MLPIIIYVAGYGRSGSTILSLMLAQVDGVVSVGEIGGLNANNLANRRCSCGQSLDKCNFWQNADNETLLSDAIAYAAQRANARYVVDSSKTAYRNFLRPWHLKKCGYDLKIIHLTRNTDAVLRSARKGKNSELEAGIIRKRRFEGLRTIIGRTFANTVVRILDLSPSYAVYRLRYEHLQKKPHEALVGLGRFLGLDLSSLIDQIEHGAPLLTGHEIGGNRLLRDGVVYFKTEPRSRHGKIGGDEQ